MIQRPANNRSEKISELKVLRRIIAPLRHSNAQHVTVNSRRQLTNHKYFLKKEEEEDDDWRRRKTNQIGALNKWNVIDERENVSLRNETELVAWKPFIILKSSSSSKNETTDDKTPVFPTREAKEN